MSGGIKVFDRGAVRAHRDRAARRAGEHGFLFDEGAERLAERLGEVRRRFPLALDLGCRDGALARALAGKGGIERLICADLSPAFAARALGSAGGEIPVGEVPIWALAADEEFLPFAAGAFDLVVSGLALHWVNDLPGALIQIRRVLKPDGLFLATLFGGDTLAELRQSLTEAEIEIAGGAGPRVSPFADVRDLGALLQRAGFALPMVDRDRITVTYDGALALMREISAMGEGNAAIGRHPRFTRRETLMRAAEIYGRRFAGADGRVRATFDILYLTAWAPDPAQPRPLRPGSASARLADALGAEEISPDGAAGESAEELAPPRRRG